MTKISLLKITIDKKDIVQSEFIKLAGRDEVRQEVDFVFKRKNGDMAIYHLNSLKNIIVIRAKTKR